MSEYPEHDKIRELDGANQTAGEFVDWLAEEKGYSLCEWREEVRHELPNGYHDTDPAGHYAIHASTEKLLYEFFGIDPDKIEAEKLHMLKACKQAVEECRQACGGKAAEKEHG